jgi:glycerol-3-phosphate cytidylyltransferase
MFGDVGSSDWDGWDMKKKTVITYGTFDLFHVGHVRLLERARALGDRLLVGLSTDEFNSLKGKNATFNYSDREVILRALRFVDDVFPEQSWDQKVDDIKSRSADVFVMGSDWQGQFDYLKAHCEVVYLPRTPEISSTDIRVSIRKML